MKSPKRQRNCLNVLFGGSKIPFKPEKLVKKSINYLIIIKITWSDPNSSFQFFQSDGKTGRFLRGIDKA